MAKRSQQSSPGDGATATLEEPMGYEGAPPDAPATSSQEAEAIAELQEEVAELRKTVAELYEAMTAEAGKSSQRRTRGLPTIGDWVWMWAHVRVSDPPRPIPCQVLIVHDDGKIGVNMHDVGVVQYNTFTEFTSTREQGKWSWPE